MTRPARLTLILLLIALSAGCAAQRFAKPPQPLQFDDALIQQRLAERDAELDTLSVWGVVTFSAGRQRGFANFSAQLDRDGACRIELSDPLFLPVLVITLQHGAMQVLDVGSDVLWVGPADPRLIQRLSGVPLDPSLLFPALSNRLHLEQGEVRLTQGDKGIEIEQNGLRGRLDNAYFLLTSFSFPLYEGSGSVQVALSEVREFDGAPLATRIAIRQTDPASATAYSVELSLEQVHINPALDEAIFMLEPGPATQIRDAAALP